MFDDIGVEGIPMYNLTQDRLRFHENGRGNGYQGSDVEKFKTLVEAGGGNTEVRLCDWYWTR